MTLILLGLVLLALFGTPLFAIFAGLALVLFKGGDIDTAAVVIEFNRLASTPMLMAIPLFTFAGYLLAGSKAPLRLIQLSRSLLGWMPGGLALVTLISCAIFTAFTGASGVTIIAIGGLLFPILLQEKYPDKFALGLITSTGSIGLLFPPSLPVILYGVISKASVDRLFIGGLIPGLLLIAIVGLYAVKIAMPIPRITFSGRAAWEAVKEAKWELPLPFVILIGIYTGKFTVTEAAAITAGYVLIVEVFIHREVHIFKELPAIMRDSMVLVGGILVILGSALGLTSFLIDAQVPNKLFEWISQFITSKYAFLALLNIFLLVVGMLMDIFSAIVVIVPLIVPIAQQFQIDPVHLGIVFLMNLEIGYLTPPIGLNLFMASYRFNRPMIELYKAAVPFILLMLVALAITTYFPSIVTGPIEWLMPGSNVAPQ